MCALLRRCRSYMTHAKRRQIVDTVIYMTISDIDKSLTDK